MSTSSPPLYTGSYKGYQLMVRDARHTDYKQVMAIDRTIYEGADYLYATYDEIMTDPAAHPLVTFVNNDLAAFNVYWVEGDTSKVMFGTTGRMLPKYRHQGVFVTIGRLCKWVMKKRFPTLEYIWGAAIYNNTVLKQSQKNGGHAVHTWFNILGSIPFSRLCESLKSPNCNVDLSAEPASVSAVVDLLSHGDTLRYLYPHGFMLYANMWRACPATLKDIQRNIRKSNVFLTRTADDMALSTMFTIKCTKGRVMNFSYSGSSDITHVKSHMLAAIKKCVAVSGLDRTRSPNIDEPSVVMGFSFTKEVNNNMIKDLLKKDLGCELHEAFFPEVALYQSPCMDTLPVLDD